MYFDKIKLLLSLCFLTFMITSCSEDDTSTSDDFTNMRASARGGGNNSGKNGGRQRDQNGNQNGGQNPQGVASIDNDILEDWMNMFLQLDQHATGMRPNATARALAYINLAAYETAVPGMDGYVSNNGLIPNFELNTTQNTEDIDWELALNTCYADVLDHFITNARNGTDTGIGHIGGRK